MLQLIFLCFAVLGLLQKPFPSQADEPHSICPEASFMKPKKAYRYQLAVCAIFRNEASYLREWIEYHKLVGVQHFYLYNNLSTDDYYSVLHPYIESGLVELFDWPFDSKNLYEWNVIQIHAYENAVQQALHTAKWLAIIDTDEFIVPVENDNILDVLKEYDYYGGVSANWQLYGTSNVFKVGPDQLMIDLLTLKAPQDYEENKFVKSIVHPEYVERITDPHYANFKKGYFHVNTDGVRLNRSIAPYIVVDKLRINHYWSRDEWFFYNFKCARRQNWQEGYDGQLNRLEAINIEPDNIMQRFVPALKQAMGISN